MSGLRPVLQEVQMYLFKMHERQEGSHLPQTLLFSSKYPFA